MGKYINKDSKGRMLPAIGKTKMLLKDGAILIKANPGFQENLVCVVHNGPFEAAGYCYSAEEYEHWTDSRDMRYKQWLIYPHAKTLAG